MKMNTRLFLVFCAILLLVVSVGADSITQYSVPSNVPLNQKITATGLFDSNAGKNGILCSFYFFDSNNNFIYRASDQYTTSTGRFTLIGTTLTEPLFKRGKEYILSTECGGITSDANFFVGQIGSIAEPMANNFEYITSPENTDTLFIWGALGGIIILVIMIFAGIILMKVH